MRTIHTKIYKFNELNEKAKERAILDQIDFECEIMSEDSPYLHIAQEMERMQTPWFLASEIWHKEKESIIETIMINEYEFFEDGSIIPVKYQSQTPEEISIDTAVRISKES